MNETTSVFTELMVKNKKLYHAFLDPTLAYVQPNTKSESVLVQPTCDQLLDDEARVLCLFFPV